MKIVKNIDLHREKSLLKTLSSIHDNIVEVVDGNGDEINTEGIAKLRKFIATKHGFDLPWDFDFQWLPSKKDIHNLQGTLPKRIATWAYRENNRKLLLDEVSEIGNIARELVSTGDLYLIGFRENLSWTDGAFGDYNVCFQGGGRSRAINMLESVNARAMLLWSKSKDHAMNLATSSWRYPVSSQKDNWVHALDRGYNHLVIDDGTELFGWGRCWLIPDHFGEGTAAVINVYPPQLQLLTVARLASEIFGCSSVIKTRMFNYKKNDEERYMWVNNQSGCVIGDAHVIEGEAVYLSIDDIDTVRCEFCGDRVDEDDISHVTVRLLGERHSKMVCQSCIMDYHFCYLCDTYVPMNETRELSITKLGAFGFGGAFPSLWSPFDETVVSISTNPANVCEDCYRDSNVVAPCPDCGDHFITDSCLFGRPSRHFLEVPNHFILGKNGMSVDINSVCPKCAFKAMGEKPIFGEYYILNRSGEVLNHSIEELISKAVTSGLIGDADGQVCSEILFR